MDNFKKFLSFSRGERIAIITIVSLIVIILIIKYLLVLNPPKRDYFKHDLDSIIARREMVMDSVRIADSVEKVRHVVGAQRATSEKSEKTYRKDNPSHKEVPHPFGVRNDSGYTANPKRHSTTPPQTKSKPARRVPTAVTVTEPIDLNAADTTMLQQLPGIGGAYAKWIVDYREKLGGYCETEQLLEVYRMDTNRFNDFERFVKIDSTFIPKRLRINSDAFKVLLKHPYLEYDDVKKIVNYREQKGLITSWKQLEKIVGEGINPRLRYYIDYQ